MSSLSDWLHRVVGGLSAAAPGYAALRIAPVPGGGLTRASTVKDTPHGRASVSWSDAEGVRTVEVVVPDGVPAEVALPDHPDGLVLQVTGGTHCWSYPCRPLPLHRLGLRTPVTTLQQEPVWKDVMAVLRKNVPVLAAAADDFDLSPYAQSLHEVLRRMPYGATLEVELRDVLERASSS